jgi:2-amino-4-hydroxy-6-hydroxymethyldihydropteridine diphosphokinase
VTLAYVALGANLGDRLANLAAALRGLAETPGASIRSVSHAYESEPWGVADQPAFANAVAAVAWAGDARSLLAACKAIESRLGRTPGERFGPRVIDLDVLLFGSETFADADLVVPHPSLLERDFVVTPLLEIAPVITLPDGTRPDRLRATLGAIVGVLGPVSGFEAVTLSDDADDR